jgi:hypothetical protein
MSDEIERLESEIVELRFQLKESRDKELIYWDILNNIYFSLTELEEEQKENERFRLGEIDYKQSVKNLKLAMEEYKRLYKVNF